MDENNPTFTADRRKGTFRAILVDPWARTITEGWQAPGLHALYSTLTGPGFPIGDENGTFPTDPADWAELDRETVAVDCIDIATLGQHMGKPVDVVIDDEGRIKCHMATWSIHDRELNPRLFAGRALFVSTDGEGETIGTNLELFALRPLITWNAWDTDYEPPAPKVFFANEGESMDQLRARAAREMGAG